MKLLRLLRTRRREYEKPFQPVRKGFLERLWRMPKARRALLFLSLFLLLGVAADLLANEKPLVAKKDGELLFPVFRSGLIELGLSQWPEELRGVDWRKVEFEWAVHPPVPYSPQNMDPRNSGTVAPFEDQMVNGMRERHWFGTDQLGRDILARAIHGTRNALLVGFGSMVLAATLGLLVGASAGFYGDHRLRLRIGHVLAAVPILSLALFQGFYARRYQLGEAWASSPLEFLGQFGISLLIFGLGGLISKWTGKGLSKIPGLSRRIPIPLDLLLMRLVDTFLSIPSLFLLLALLAVLGKPSTPQLILVIGFLSWCHITRLIRAEFLRIRELPYIEATRAIGISDKRTMFYHALPNALSPILIATSYGMATAILTASALSFLGLTPGDMTSWGGMLADARNEAMAWWLVLFPGAAIFLLVWNFNILGEALQRLLQGEKGTSG